MRVDVTGMRAARETTAFVAGAERAAQRWRDAAGLATDAQRFAFGVLDKHHDAAIAA
jgi:hypothetical protein